jgi:hypothetical protein
MAYITIEEVQEAVENIRRIGLVENDNELAHIEEDALYNRVLHDIAGGHPDPMSIAAAALHAAELNYGRWYS